MTGHRQTTSKIKSCFFTTCLNRANDRAIERSLIIEVEGKRFFKTVTLKVLTKKVVFFYQIRHWQKTYFNRRLLLEFF